jgi:MFS family permease
MITVYALPAQLSPAIGPILGAICQRYLDWRWTFWIVSMISVALQVLCFLTVHETYKPALERRFQRAQRNKELQLSLFTQIAELFQDVGTRLRANMFRPLKMLVTHP